MMTRAPATPCRNGRVTVARVAISLFVLLVSSVSLYTYAQPGEKVREIQANFVSEPGCPVSVNSIKTALDLDPFDVPIDGRIYINYKNISDRQIEAVKFRIGMVDATGALLGTFQASDAATLAPGADHEQKWRREPIDRGIAGTMIRVLQVKCPDGTMWQSSKMQEVPQGAQPGS